MLIQAARLADQLAIVDWWSLCRSALSPSEAGNPWQCWLILIQKDEGTLGKLRNNDVT